eukprot:gnl/Chilomastix_caulleri/1746.p1 GENE.gnl/Chilomastix_caulleri/1746~~gnl/Chilomastix_caulleri/1746.p1  ORF type:complete len:131 (+),score=27.11 gnl/Chilomastix_caulleri/1746:82-474(+)
MLLRGGRIQSDVDNQIIINLTFNGLSQIRNFIFTIPERETAPNEVCFYADKTIDFEGVEDFKPTLKIDLKKQYTGKPDQKIIVPLGRSFGSVTKMGVYFPSSDGETTVISRLTIDGSEKQGGIRKPLEKC